MAIVVDIVMEVGLVVHIRAIEQSCGLDRTNFSEQIVQKKESFFVIVLTEDESRWKQMQIFDICLIMSDSLYICAFYLML